MGFIDVRSAYGWLSEHAMGNPVDVDRVVAVVLPSQRETMRVPDGVVFAPLQEWPSVPARFALQRGIAAWQVDRWGIGYVTKGVLAGRIFLPAWGPGGDLQNYTARTFLRSPLRYRSAQRQEGIVDGAMFGEQMWSRPDARDVVVVTEGVLNALAVERVSQLPIAAMFGSNVCLEHLAKMSTFRHVVVLTDPDPAGDWAAEKLAFAFARHKEIHRAMLPRGVDANDLERQDPAKLQAVLRDAGAIR
jgi:5S rRNA maturation endonuclease (ribonuclease M5)